jgi:hypothetical protein
MCFIFCLEIIDWNWGWVLSPFGFVLFHLLMPPFAFESLNRVSVPPIYFQH